jgi:hypothetical protein
MSEQKIIGYIILNPNTDVGDWDDCLHLTEESAIESLTGPHDPYCRTEAERTDDIVPWWEDYDIHPVCEGVRRKQEERA